MIKTEKLKVKSKDTSVNGGIVNVRGGSISFSEDAIDQILTVLEKRRESHWYIKHSNLLETLYLVRDTLVSLRPEEDLNTIKEKLVKVLEEAIGIQK